MASSLSWRQTLPLLFACFGPNAQSSAQPPAAGEGVVAVATAASTAESAPRPRHDYSRFSDGPRRVPESRGASLARAERLELGTRATASRLLHRPARERWVEAAGGRSVGPLAWPVEQGRFGRGFGFVRRRRPDVRHDGVDIVAAEGSVVRAAAPGIVAYSDNGVRGFGNLVMIVHPNGWVTFYAHLFRATVQPGWRVRAGERIGFVGNTGISRGPHLHFELRRGGHPINPLPHFEGRPWIDAYREWQADRQSGEYAAPELPTGTLPPESTTASPPASPLSSTSTIPEFEGVRALLDHGAASETLEALPGRHFRTLLWPTRGGALDVPYSRRRRGLRISTEGGAPVRAAADGRVVHAGEGLRGVGGAVVLLHPNGWITVYGSTDVIHVEVGDDVLRGEWVATTGENEDESAHLYFQLRRDGAILDPSGLLVGVP